MEPRTLLAVFFAVLLLLALFAWWWETLRGSRRSKARLRVAAKGESDAEALLADAGYEILDRQVRRVWSLEIDGELIDVICRADLLVARAGREFIAEVKTGNFAPDPSRPATRRQLLEYQIVFPVDGVLLVDMVARRIHTVHFPALGPDG